VISANCHALDAFEYAYTLAVSPPPCLDHFTIYVEPTVEDLYPDLNLFWNVDVPFPTDRFEIMFDPRSKYCKIQDNAIH
jgi:hypothetical protein